VGIFAIGFCELDWTGDESLFGRGDLFDLEGFGGDGGVGVGGDDDEGGEKEMHCCDGGMNGWMRMFEGNVFGRGDLYVLTMLDGMD
jgi:hypothetical protein